MTIRLKIYVDDVELEQENGEPQILKFDVAVLIFDMRVVGDGFSEEDLDQVLAETDLLDLSPDIVAVLDRAGVEVEP
jgi:hypothetical protein